MDVKNSIPPIFGDVMNLRAMSGLDTKALELVALINSATYELVEVFRSDIAGPIGYLAWADISKYTLAHMEKCKSRPRYTYEWDEGNICLVVDVLFLKPWGGAAKKQMLQLLRKKKAIVIFRRGKLRLYIRKLNRFYLCSRLSSPQ